MTSGDEDTGRLRLVAFVGLLVAGLSVTLAAGFVIADDQPSGESILTDVQETYNTADSVAGEAVVTVETDAGVNETTVGFVTAGEENARFNLSDGDRYVLTGTNGDVAWVYDPETEVTGVVERTDDTVTFSLRTGTEDVSNGPSSLLQGLGIDANTTVGELRERLGGQLPAEFEQQLANVSNDTTLAELSDETDSEFVDAVANGEPADLPAGVNGTIADEFDGELPAEFNETIADEFDGEVPAEINESTVQTFAKEFLAAAENGTFDDALPEEVANDLSDRAEALEDAEFDEMTTEEVTAEIDAALPEEFDNIEEYESVEAVVEDFEAVLNETNVEFVGTTTVDGEEANELLVTHPELDGETRLYTSVETDEVLKQVTTTPNATVTVDVVDTRFDVGPADSTFEPRGVTEIATLTVETTTAETRDALDDAAPFATVVPDDAWTFERGAVISTTGSLSVPGVAVDTESLETTAATAVYTADEHTLGVIQRPTPEGLNQTTLTELGTTDLTSVLESELDTEIAFDTEVDVETTTTTIGDREVVLTTTADGTSATWIEGDTVVTVVGDLDQGALESVVAATGVGAD